MLFYKIYTCVGTQLYLLKIIYSYFFFFLGIDLSHNYYGDRRIANIQLCHMQCKNPLFQININYS